MSETRVQHVGKSSPEKVDYMRTYVDTEPAPTVAQKRYENTDDLKEETEEEPEKLKSRPKTVFGTLRKAARDGVAGIVVTAITILLTVLGWIILNEFSMNREIGEAKKEIDGVKSDFEAQKSDISEMKLDIKENFSQIDSQMENLKGKIVDIDKGLLEVKIKTEK